MERRVRVQESQLQGEQPLCSGGYRSEDRDVKYPGKLDIKSHTGSRSEMNGENAPLEWNCHTSAGAPADVF